MTKGWNSTRQTFVQHYDSESLDASNLLMSMVFFLSPNDPRMLKTLDAINRAPKHGGLASDGLGGVDRSVGFTDSRPYLAASLSAERRIV